MRKYRTIALALLGAALGAPALAHHNSGALFDRDAEISIAGTVTRFDWRNPHVYVEVSAPDSNGETQRWRFEGSPLAFMRQRGWTRDTLRLGDRVTVTANPSRTAGRRSGFMADISVDGRQVPPLRGPEADARRDALETARASGTDTLAGTWLALFDQDIAWIDDPSELPTTPAGRAAIESFDERTMHPGLDCVPNPAPVMMLIPDIKSIEIAEDAISIYGDFDGTKRTIYLDGRGPAGRTVHGHSRGRWEDGALVIETDGFTDHVFGIAYSLPSGSRKRLVERLELVEEGTALRYVFELSDPEFLTETLTGESRWLYRPDLEFVLTPCDVESSRGFLED